MSETKNSPTSDTSLSTATSTTTTNNTTAESEHLRITELSLAGKQATTPNQIMNSELATSGATSHTVESGDTGHEEEEEEVSQEQKIYLSQIESASAMKNYTIYSETSSSDGGGDTSSSAVDQDLLDQQPLNFCERIPLVLKLFLIGVVSLLGITVVGTWLVVQSGVNLNTAVSKHSLLYVIEETEVIKNYIEREMTANFGHQVISANVQEIGKRWSETDRAVENYLRTISDAANAHGSFSARGALESLQEHLNILPDIRDQVRSNTIDPQDMTHYYSECYIKIMDVGMHMVTASDMRQSVLQQNLISRIKSRDFALTVVISSMAFTRSNFSDEVMERYIIHVQDRNTNIRLFKGMAGRSIVKMYEDYVESMPEHTYLTRLERRISNNLDSDRFNINANEYYTNASKRLESIDQVLQEANGLIQIESNQYVARSIAEIVAVIVVAIVFFILTIMVSLCMSSSIVGPWKRMLKLQEMTIQRFVPSQFLGLLECRKISELTRGKKKERNLTIMIATISNFSQIIQSSQERDENGKIISKGMNPRLVHFVNQYLEYISEIIRTHNGYIENYDREMVIACFKGPSSAISCALHYQQAIDTFNSIHLSDYPSAKVTIGIHFIEHVLIAAVGDHDRIHTSFLSEEMDIARKLNDLAYKHHAKIMTTCKTYDRVQKFTKKLMKPRLLCKLINYSGEILDCLELLSVNCKGEETKLKSAQVFSQAMQQLYKANYLDALISFQSASKLTGEKDHINKHFIKLCERFLTETRSNMSSVSLIDILADKALLQAFKAYCAAEHSEENIELWTLIETFKSALEREERSEIASLILSEYLNPNANHCVNLPESVKKKTIDHYEEIANKGMCSTCTVPCTIMNNSIFHQIQNSIELVMSDTFRRFQVSDSFSEAYKRSSLVIKPSKLYYSVKKHRI